MGTFNSKVYTLKNIQIFKHLGTKKGFNIWQYSLSIWLFSSHIFITRK